MYLYVYRFLCFMLVFGVRALFVLCILGEPQQTSHATIARRVLNIIFHQGYMCRLDYMHIATYILIVQ